MDVKIRLIKSERAGVVWLSEAELFNSRHVDGGGFFAIMVLLITKC